ncbi:alpha/beta fold hydrolase [Seohaeicola zhoushanensis]
MPALFMTGEAEPNSTPAMSRAMAELAPQGQALVVPGAAHMLPMTHPDVVNAALLDLAADCLP